MMRCRCDDSLSGALGMLVWVLMVWMAVKDPSCAREDPSRRVTVTEHARTPRPRGRPLRQMRPSETEPTRNSPVAR